MIFWLLWVRALFSWLAARFSFWVVGVDQCSGTVFIIISKVNSLLYLGSSTAYATFLLYGVGSSF